MRAPAAIALVALAASALAAPSRSSEGACPRGESGRCAAEDLEEAGLLQAAHSIHGGADRIGGRRSDATTTRGATSSEEVHDASQSWGWGATCARG
eukprot:5569904-Pyramimonas_sp.AAC.1